ncbi:hypothetical protein ACIP27_27130, partial [Streptomyces hydrogenans]|uniref:hypothetical protein n=1 Tax=Streptomyces hydrogenans TaxID=1873719 RepID=UPI0037F9A9F2
RVAIDYASHTAHVDEVLDDVRRELAAVAPRADGLRNPAASRPATAVATAAGIALRMMDRLLLPGAAGRSAMVDRKPSLLLR